MDDQDTKVLIGFLASLILVGVLCVELTFAVREGNRRTNRLQIEKVHACAQTEDEAIRALCVVKL